VRHDNCFLSPNSNEDTYYEKNVKSSHPLSEELEKEYCEALYLIIDIFSIALYKRNLKLETK